jgi:hypothetical protein
MRVALSRRFGLRHDERFAAIDTVNRQAMTRRHFPMYFNGNCRIAPGECQGRVEKCPTCAG